MGRRVAAVALVGPALVLMAAAAAWASWRLVRAALGTGCPSPLSGLWAPWQRPLDAPTPGLFERRLPDLGGDGPGPRVRAVFLALARAGLLGARSPSPREPGPGGERPPASPLEALDPLFASWSGRGHASPLPLPPTLSEAADRVKSVALGRQAEGEASHPGPAPTPQEATAARDHVRLRLAWRAILAGAVPLGLFLGPYLGFSCGPERPALALCMAGALAAPTLVAIVGLTYLAGDPWGWYHTHLLGRPDTPEGIGATVGDALWVLLGLWASAAMGLAGLLGRPGAALAAALTAALWVGVACLLALGDREALVRLWTHLARAMAFAAAAASLAGPAPALLWTGLGGAPVAAWALLALALAPWRAYHMAWPGRSPSLRQWARTFVELLAGALAVGHVAVLGLGGLHVALAVWFARLLAVRLGEEAAEAAPDPRGRPSTPRGLKGGWSFRGAPARRGVLALRVGAPCLLALAAAGPLPEGPTWLPWRLAAEGGATFGRAFEVASRWLVGAADAAPLAADGTLGPVGLAFLLALVALAWAPWARVHARVPA